MPVVTVPDKMPGHPAAMMITVPVMHVRTADPDNDDRTTPDRPGFSRRRHKGAKAKDAAKQKGEMVFHTMISLQVRSRLHDWTRGMANAFAFIWPKIARLEWRHPPAYDDARRHRIGAATISPMSSLPKHYLTPEEFLAFERAADSKHEYHDGMVVAMAGGSVPHSALAMNLGSELRQHLKGRPCTVFNSDMKVWTGESRHYFYPDLSGLCGPVQTHDSMHDVLLNPTFIVEILSPRTEAFDRGKKLARYMELPSILEIVLVAQDEIRVDKYTRQSDGIWRFDGYSGSEAVIPFISVQCEVRLGDFYEGVDLRPPSTTDFRIREEHSQYHGLEE
jgi:Uma2 family endonuclease